MGVSPYEEIQKVVDFPFNLHQYQIDDINSGCEVGCFGAYLDPGLGKTAVGTAIGIYKLLKGFNSVIVLCPASIITQWVEWLKSLELVVCEYRAAPEERKHIDLDADFIVMSPQIYLRDYKRLDIKDAYYIVDEATNLCNIDNTIFKYLRGGIVKEKEFKVLSNGYRMELTKDVKFPRRMSDCCLLTGTPINDPLAAYGLISITNPTAYPNFSNFYRKHVAAEDNFKRPVAFRGLTKIHDNLTTNAVIREVGDHLDLPDKIYRVIKYDLTPEHLKVYNDLIDNQMVELEDGEIVDATQATKLYHLCQQFIWCPLEFGGKIAGIEVMDTLVRDTRKRLIFNKYRGTNELLMKRYKAGGCFGSVSRAKQTEYISSFKAGDLATLVINPKSGGVGLNLQVCDQIFFGETPVTSNDLKQSEARCWRQGQQNTVVITLLIARKTIQLKLLQEIMNKDDTKIKVLQTKESLRKNLRGEL